MLKWKCWTQGDGEVIGGSSLYDMWSNSKAGWQGLKFIQPLCRYAISHKCRCESWVCANNELWNPMKKLYEACEAPDPLDPSYPAFSSEFEGCNLPRADVAPKDRGPEPWAVTWGRRKTHGLYLHVVNKSFQELKPFVTALLSLPSLRTGQVIGQCCWWAATLLHWTDQDCEMIHNDS